MYDTCSLFRFTRVLQIGSIPNGNFEDGEIVVRNNGNCAVKLAFCSNANEEPISQMELNECLLEVFFGTTTRFVLFIMG